MHSGFSTKDNGSSIAQGRHAEILFESTNEVAYTVKANLIAHIC